MTSTPSRLFIGKIGKPHGVKGAFFLNSPDRRTSWEGPREILIISANNPNEVLPAKLEQTFVSGGKLAISLQGVSSRNAIEAKEGDSIFVELPHSQSGQVARNQNQEEEFLVNDLLGCQVVENGDVIGKVIQVFNTGAQENLEIELLDGKSTFYFPFTETFVLKVDLANHSIHIHHSQDFR